MNAITTITYDGCGNVESINDACGRSKPYFPCTHQCGTFVGRFAGSLDQRIFGTPGSESIVFTYDDEDKLLTATAADDGVMTNTYDLSQLEWTIWVGDVDGRVSRTFDDAGRVGTQSINDATSVTFTYDAANRLTGAGALSIVRFNDADEDGRIHTTTLGDVTDERDYGANGDYIGYSASTTGPTPTPLIDSDYTRDTLGRIGTRVESIGGGSENTYLYTYDAAGRLIEVAKNTTPVAHYNYDANGNRAPGSFNASGTLAAATYDSQDRLLSTQTVELGTQNPLFSTEYAYTANGELRAKTMNGTDVTTYGYDVFGNLLRVDLPDDTVIEYLVDGANRHIGKKVDSTLVQGFLYDSQLRIAADLNGAGTLVSRFVYTQSPNVPEYMVKGGVTYRLIKDHLGSVRLVVNSTTGAIAQQIDYDEFGIVLSDSAPGFQPFGFAGGLYDHQTELVRFGVRDYDASIGRWTGKDPIDFSGGDTNLYAYVSNDPIGSADPSGLASGVGGAGGLNSYQMPMGGISNLGVLLPISANPIKTCKILYLGVKALCDKTRCHQLDHCDVLRAKILMKQLCAALQEDLSAICYPEKRSHEQRGPDQSGGILKCEEYLLLKGCVRPPAACICGAP